MACPRIVRRSIGFLLLLGVFPLETKALAAAPQAQFHHVQGGFVSWPWVWKDPSGPGHRVWTSEDGGRIRFRDTSGVWHYQSPPTHTKVYRHIYFRMDGQTGIAVGDSGQWAWTLAGHTPSGAWHGEPPIQFPPGQTPRFRNIYMSETGENWVVGDNGVLASTTSLLGQGLTQNSFTSLDPVANGIDLLGIDFVDGTTIGAATGQRAGGIIYYTLNGVAWTPATITFLDPTTGQPALPPAGVMEIWHVNFCPGPGGIGQLIGYAVGGIGNGTGYMFRTTDGGQTWTQEFHVCAGIHPCPIPSSCNFPPQTCPPGPAPVGENVWSQALTLYSVSAYQDGSAIACGYGGGIVRRGPTGGSPRWVEVNDLCNFHTSVLWGSGGDGVQTAWLTGVSNTIRRTDNGGLTWTNEGWDRAWRLREVAFVSGGGAATGDVGWACGQQMRIAKTTDGGVTWTEQRAELSGPNFGKNILGLAFHNDGNASQADDNGVAVGLVWTSPPPQSLPKWGIFYTTNGGSSCGWQPATVDPLVPMVNMADAAFAGVNGASQREFWAVGPSNTVLRSVNNGATWAAAGPSGTSGVNWTGVSFNSIDVGFIVGSSGSAGKAYFVQNASTSPTWTDATPVAGCLPLAAVHLVGVNAYAVGQQGTVLKYNRIQGKFVAVTGVGQTNDLLSVAVVGATSPHEVFVGGVDGVLSHLGSSGWAPRKSHTNSNLTGLSFLSSTLGYGCGSSNETVGGQSTIVKYY